MSDSPYSYPDASQVAPADQIRSAAVTATPKPGYYDPKEAQSADNDAATKLTPKPGYYDPQAPSK